MPDQAGRKATPQPAVCNCQPERLPRHAPTLSCPREMGRGTTGDQDQHAALAYWSEQIRPTLGDLPTPALRHLRDRYVLDVQDNPAALAQLREWWRTYGAARYPYA